MNRIPKAVYTKEFREEAVKLALTEGVGVSEAARRLSIPMKSLANWVRAAKAGKLGKVGQGQKPLTELEMELNRVKRELAEVKMERDLLKKFAAYFAKESRSPYRELVLETRFSRIPSGNRRLQPSTTPGTLPTDSTSTFLADPYAPNPLSACFN